MRNAATTAPPVVSRLSPLLPVSLELLERNTECQTLASLNIVICSPFTSSSSSLSVVRHTQKTRSQVAGLEE